MQSDIAQRAIGRWHGILPALGIRSEFLTGKHGPCPCCGGKDRFRFDNKEGKGTFYCTHCGAGEGFKLVMLIKGVSFREAMNEVGSVVGAVNLRAIPKVRSLESCRSDMRKAWRSAVEVTEACPVGLYLKRRTGITSYPQVLRSSSDRSAMLALMQAPDSRATMIHLTLLTEDGRQANLQKPKLMMPGKIVKGSAVRLTEIGEELGIAEGIETALSATKLSGVPCWAALNDVLLQQWEPPTGVKAVWVFGDSDINYVGQHAAYSLARRLKLRDKSLTVHVRLPTELGADWNDVLNRKNNS